MLLIFTLRTTAVLKDNAPGDSRLTCLTVTHVIIVSGVVFLPLNALWLNRSISRALQ